MIAAIHQPHYFPWIGYFDKMAKADVFVLLDEVQLERSSNMSRNRIIAPNGDIKYIMITANQHDRFNKKYNEILTVDDEAWKKRSLAMLEAYYGKAPYYFETIKKLREFYAEEHVALCQWTIASIRMIRKILEIPTELVLQSDINYDRSKKRSELVMAVCLGMGADVYLSGRGASLNYLDRGAFEENGIQIVFQDFTHPMYPQINTKEFVPGISILDMLFNCGVGETKRIFWENVNSSPDMKLLGAYRSTAHAKKTGG